MIPWVSPSVSPSTLLNEFILNFVLWIYTGSCLANLIVVLTNKTREYFARVSSGGKFSRIARQVWFNTAHNSSLRLHCLQNSLYATTHALYMKLISIFIQGDLKFWYNT
jgi:hypothetical protein